MAARPPMAIGPGATRSAMSIAAGRALSSEASTNAVAWQQEWLTLGDTLLRKYVMGMVDGQTVRYPKWWKDLIGRTGSRNRASDRRNCSERHA